MDDEPSSLEGSDEDSDDMPRPILIEDTQLAHLAVCNLFLQKGLFKLTWWYVVRERGIHTLLVRLGGYYCCHTEKH